MRLLLAVLVAAVLGKQLAKSPVTPTDGDIINEALRVTALQEIARFAKPPSPPASLALVNQSAAVCDAMPPRTFCLDSIFKTLELRLPGRSLVAALRERNRTSTSLASLQLSTGTLVPRGERGSQRNGRSVAQVSLPAIESETALIVVLAQFAGSQVWAVELARRDQRWRAIRVEHLMSGG